MKFTCCACQETFNSDRDDKETTKEFYETFPEAKSCSHEDIGDMCERCYIVFMEWLSKKTEEDKRKMREEYNASK